jgi:hypothetical protein
MTEPDETPQAEILPPEPVPPPPHRNLGRLLPQPPRHLLPWLGALALLLLAGSQAALWSRVLLPPSGPGTLASRVQAIDARLTRLEQRPVPQAPDLGPLTTRVAALEQKTSTDVADPRLQAIEGRLAHLEQRSGSPPSDLSPLQARVAALERRPAPQAGQPGVPPAVGSPTNVGAARAAASPSDAGPPPPASSPSDSAPPPAAHSPTDAGAAPKALYLGPLEARIAALEQKPPAATPPSADASLAQRLTDAEAQLATLEKMAHAPAPASDRTNRIARIQAAFIALSVGQPLGDLPGAPPALARYATSAPPTEAALRLAFPAAARAALAADHPAPSDKPVLDRIWAEAQDLVTIRQGERVLLGDPAAGVLAHAQTALDAGDLAGAAAAVASLTGPQAQALAPWLDQVHGLLAARAALAALAAQT